MKHQKLRLIVIGILSSVSLFAQNSDLECAENVKRAENFFRGTTTILKDKDRAMEILTPCLNANNAEAQHLYGLVQLGAYKVFKTDESKAFEYIEKAALQGNADALCNLAILYKMGRGCKIDFDKATEVYKAAYELGSTKAAFKLGVMHFKGLGSIDQSYYKAMDWFLKSDYPLTDYYLGISNFYGFGVPVNKQKALDILKESNLPNCKSLYEQLSTIKTTTTEVVKDVAVSTETENSDKTTVQNVLETSEIDIEADDFKVITIMGDWEGKLVEFDWATQKILRSSPASLNFSFDQKTAIIDYKLTTDNQTASNFTISLDKTLYFEKLQLNLTRFYGNAQESTTLNYKVVAANISQKSLGASNYLILDLETQVIEWKEPGPPMQLILQRKNKVTTENGVAINEEVLQALAANKDSFISLYPNPFVTDLLVEYDLEEQSNVSVAIFSYLDQSSTVLEAGASQEPGKYTYHLDGSSMKTGLYIVKVTTNSQVHTKMIVKEN